MDLEYCLNLECLRSYKKAWISQGMFGAFKFREETPQQVFPVVIWKRIVHECILNLHCFLEVYYLTSTNSV